MRSEISGGELEYGSCHQQQLQGVVAGRQGNLCLRLPPAEMQMIEVVWNRLVQGRQLGIDQEMVVTGVFPVGAGGGYSIPFRPK